MARPDEYPEELMKAKEVRESRLPLSHQENALAELQVTIGELFDVLSPILTPEMPEPGQDKEASAEPIQSPLADRLDRNNREVRRATERLRSIIKRAEV